MLRLTAGVILGLCAAVVCLPSSAGGGPARLAQAAPEIVGKARVIDGDTLEVGGQAIRLYGLDAPESGETCTAGGTPWPCGENAAFALAYATAEHWLRCEAKGTDAAGRIVAVCFAGPYDLNAIMVREGWARASPAASPGYAEEEAAARAAGAGMWRP
ncbi:thermonuclease family protein [Shumkonia mesophila]|uniref:thermonuclease family protein n=1 Tax=Shumkonia mesophila TaxID=2838854 RepID=UPI002934778C|nr:thermonuclease family protein [Shumkonia mesophila]